MSLTSYNGYPASKDPNEIGIKSYSVDGTALRLRCASSVGPLLAAFAAEFPDAQILLPHANQNRQDYIDRGYVHLAGTKDNPTKLHHASEMVREDFPSEYASTFAGFAGLRS